MLHWSNASFLCEFIFFFATIFELAISFLDATCHCDYLFLCVIWKFSWIFYVHNFQVKHFDGFSSLFLLYLDIVHNILKKIICNSRFTILFLFMIFKNWMTLFFIFFCSSKICFFVCVILFNAYNFFSRDSLLTIRWFEWFAQ